MKRKMLIFGCITVLAITMLTGCGSIEEMQSAYSSDDSGADASFSENISKDGAEKSTVTTTGEAENTTATDTADTTVVSSTTAGSAVITTAKSSKESIKTTATTAKATTKKQTTKSTAAATQKTTIKTTAKTTAATTATTASAQQQAVFRLVNEERAKAGLAALTYCYAAQEAADIRAAEITQLFSHTRPNGEVCFTALDGLGISYTAAGENIAMGQTTPEWVMESWMNSQGHRENILNSNFNAMVIGFKDNHWVQLFLRI